MWRVARPSCCWGLAHVKLDGDRVPIEFEGGGTFAYINHAGTPVFTYNP